MALFCGVDVQGNELIVACRRDGVFVPPSQVVARSEDVSDYVLQLRQHESEEVIVAIDAPRFYLRAPRLWELRRAGDRWIAATPRCGRHCELIVRRMGLANPQWTPIITQPIPWISLGQSVFATCEQLGFVAIECFPTATYARLGNMDDQHVTIPGQMFAHGRLNHDVVDACVAALTAEYSINGNATELGGGDGYGTIVVPGILDVPFPPYPQM